MRWFLIAFLLLCNAASAQLGTLPYSGASPVALSSVQTLKIGGGGFLTGMAISTDGTTKVAKTDTYGAYASVASINSGAWFQLLAPSGWPIADQKSGIYGGAYEVAVAPSSPSHIYLYENGFVYESLNSGLTFVKTGFSQVAENPNDNNRTMGRFMALDPQNSAILYVGTSTQLWVSTNAGNGASTIFTHITQVPDASPAGGGTGGITITFDPHSTVSGGKQQGIYASSYSNGLYHSTDGGANWSLVASSPTTFSHVICDQTGVVYVVDNTAGGTSGALNKYNGSWSNFTSLIGANIRAVAVNPSNASAIYASKDNGSLIGSANGGSTWPVNTNSYISAIDIPWLANTFEEGSLSVGDIQFDPSVSNTLYFAEGIGIWTLNPPVTAASVITWTSQTAAIEQLVTTGMMSSPGNSPIATVEDRPYFRITNPAVYPSTQLRPIVATSASSVQIPSVTDPAIPTTKAFVTASAINAANSTYVYVQETSNPANVMFGQVTSIAGNNINVSVYRVAGAVGSTFSDWTIMWDSLNSPIVYGWAADYAASSPTTVVALANLNGNDLTSVSTDGGATMTRLVNVPSPVNGGGCIAASSASNFVIVQSNNGFIFNSTDTGNTWTQRNPSGWPTSGPTGVGFLANNRGKGCAADRVTANKFYVWNYGPPGALSIAGVWASTDSGATWSQVSGTVDLTSGGAINNFTLKSVPGNAGHLFFTPGLDTNAGGAFPSGVNFKRSTDGAATWTNVANVQNVSSFGFGMAKPGGGGYPAIFCYCWVGVGATFTNGQAAIAVANNYAANDIVSFSTTGSLPTGFAISTNYYVLSTGLSKTSIQVSATPGGAAITAASAGSGTQKAIAGGLWESDDSASTWFQLTNIYPNNTMDSPTTVEGDANTYGTAYMGGGGSGFYLRKLNFLLQRDLGHVNDNRPAGINIAA